MANTYLAQLSTLVGLEIKYLAGALILNINIV